MTQQNDISLPDIARCKTRPAYSRLKSLIRTNRLRPYEPLRPHHLATTLTSGVTPIREALQRLACDSLVTWSHNRGHFTKAYDTAEIGRLFDLAQALLTFSIRTYLVNPAAFPNRRTARGLLHPDCDRTADVDDPTETERSYQNLVALGRNAEMTRVIENIIDRTHAISLIEANFETAHRSALGYSRAELETVMVAVSRGTVEDALKALSAHIQRRLRNVADCVRDANAIACRAPLP